MIVRLYGAKLKVAKAPNKKGIKIKEITYILSDFY